MGGGRHGEVRITSLTLVTFALVVYGLLSRRGYGQALALGGATPVGAALVVGAIAVPTFYAVAVGALVLVALRLLRRREASPGDARIPVPASRALVLLVLISVLVTLVAPVLFNGLPVQTPTGLYGQLTAGVISKSNVAQITYLVLSVGVVAYLARSRGARPQLVGMATCIATLLSFWSWTHTAVGVPFPVGLFDNSPTFAFVQTLPTGEPRVRGILSEPSGLAATCLVTIAYCASRLWQVRGARRLGILITASIAVFLGWISTSTSFLVAGIALLVVAAVVATATFVLRGSAAPRGTVVMLCGVALASLWLLPSAANTIGQQLSDKVQSTSYVDRSSADAASYQLVLDTFGFGTGLGSNRASSFVSSLLSTVGVAGAVVLVVAVGILMRRSWSVRQVRPVMWALITLLLCKVVSGPDLSDSSGVLWISLGVLASAALRREAQTPGAGTSVHDRLPAHVSPGPADLATARSRTHG